MARHAVLTFAFATLAASAAADTITLTNGRVIQADRTWYQGDQLLYEKNGGTYGLPRSLVARLEQRTLPAPTGDPDILDARRLLADGKTIEAVRRFRAVTVRDPRLMAAWQGLAEAQMALGDARAAREAATQAARLDPTSARSHALLGDALAALGDRAGAEEAYRRSLELRADPDVKRKLGDVLPAPTAPSRGAQFRLKYDGGVNEPLGVAVLKSLTDAYGEFAMRLGVSPEDPITVVLQTAAEFQDPRVPGWAEGVNDGTIRVPVQGLAAPTPRLVGVLRHELAHSFIAARTGGNCPTWLQEGVSQWLEGGDPHREDARLAPAAREGKLLSLASLEGPFDSLTEHDAELAYAQSLSAVAHILARSGEPGLVRLLAALGDRLPSEEALPVALALSYPELQKSWVESLKTAEAKRP